MNIYYVEIYEFIPYLDLLGVLVSFFLVSITAYLYPRIALILYSAYFLRISLSIINIFYFVLPDGANDARKYESTGWEMSLHGIENAISLFPGFFSSYFFQWLISVIYAFVGDRAVLIISSFSVVLSVLSVLLVWKICIELWDYRSAKITAWIVALYPTLAMYGSLTVKEPFYVFFLLCGIWFVIKIQSQNAKLCVVKSGIFFVIAGMFHPSGIIALVILLLTLLFSLAFNRPLLASTFNMPTLVSTFNRHRPSYFNLLHIRNFVLILMCSMAAVYFIIVDMSISKYDFSISQTVDFDYWHKIFMTRYIESRASYPTYLVSGNVNQYLTTIPIRILYFLFAPFPWDVSSYSHLLGVVDGFFYMFVMIRLWSLRHLFHNNTQKTTLLFIVVAIILIFSLIISNFGTGMRHRAKILPLLLILTSPRLKIFSLNK